MLSGFFQRREKRLRQEIEEWFLSMQHRLLAYARQQSDDVTDVELLLAEVMSRVTAAYCAGRVEKEGVLPYALRSLRNAAMQARSRNMRRREVESVYSREEQERQRGDAAAGDLMHELAQLVHQLPEEEAHVLTLRIWDERSFADVARELGLPESTVRRRYAAALERIRTIMNQS
ncbi:MAG: sigma-70 family RNA polymerase sigma factor [Akkermansia sp.]|nr:sigma-70 family RNA polymerase sigma factor [Akkermansia sp.]